MPGARDHRGDTRAERVIREREVENTAPNLQSPATLGQGDNRGDRNRLGQEEAGTGQDQSERR